ncbi:MAG: amidohydrolase family protein [Acidobacteria bacterium]|nr:amidohydrolase family protein [Acidobacteriota bacterium]
MRMDGPSPGLISRRAFAAGMGLAGAARLPGAGPAKVIDCHAHLTHHGNPGWEEADRRLIDAADRLGIGQLCCSLLSPRRPARPEDFRQCNDWAAEAMRRYPGRILCYCFVNPGYGREAREEIARCVEKLGFIGVKLYNDYVATEPVVWPVVEQAIALSVPILHHAGHTYWLSEPQPRISDGGTFAELAGRYPEAMLICAHAAGGGDWEWTIKALRNAPGVYLDTSGSVPDEGVVEMAVRTLGAGRILFGCDMSLTASVGRIRSAELSDADRAAILGGNMQRILARRRAG